MYLVHFINIRKHCGIPKRLWRGVKNYLSPSLLFSCILLAYFPYRTVLILLLFLFRCIPSAHSAHTDWNTSLVWLYVILIVPALICVHVSILFCSPHTRICHSNAHWKVWWSLCSIYDMFTLQVSLICSVGRSVDLVLNMVWVLARSVILQSSSRILSTTTNWPAND